jgi:hypothetical protein
MGKANQRRMCPALGREITSAECGEGRHSRYSCPAQCPHNPFARETYTRLLELEDKLDARTLERMLSEAPDRGLLDRAIREAAAGKSEHAMHAFFVWQLFFARDAMGLTCAQRWERAGFPGLQNDERVLLRGKMGMRVALLEFHRMLDADRVEAVDLLAPGTAPVVIVDRSVASRAVRFDAYLTWTYPLPHFSRMSGTAIVIPEMGEFAPEEIVNEIVRHLGGPAEGEAARGWLAQHFVRVAEAMTATAHERRRRMLAGVDAQFGVASYELRAGFLKARAKLDRAPEVATDDLDPEERGVGFTEARVWFDFAGAASVGLAAGGQVVLGRVLLGPKVWRVEAMGAAKLAKLRTSFEARMGNGIRFLGERRDDLGARMALAEPEGDLKLVPPRLLEQGEQIALSTSRIPAPPAGMTPEEVRASVMADNLRAYPDTTVPALDGRTPRQAAGDLILRPRLVRLMKGQIRRMDAENLRSGRADDINWLLRELGLHEIDFPPPPRRALVADDEDDEDENEACHPSVGGQNGRSRPAAEPLPEEALSLEEVSARMNRALDGFDTAASAMEELEASGSTLLDEVDELTAELLSEEEFQFLVTFLLHGWFALVPAGRMAPGLRGDAMVAALAHELKQIPRWTQGKPDETIAAIVDGSRQPGLVQLLLAEMFEGASQAPKKLRPDPDSIPLMIAVLKVVTNEVHDALQR